MTKQEKRNILEQCKNILGDKNIVKSLRKRSTAMITALSLVTAGGAYGVSQMEQEKKASNYVLDEMLEEFSQETFDQIKKIITRDKMYNDLTQETIDYFDTIISSEDALESEDLENELIERKMFEDKIFGNNQVEKVKTKTR